MTTDRLLPLLRDAEEVTVRTRRDDGSPVDTVIWSVVADGRPYLRSVFGARGKWWQRADRTQELEVLVDGAPVRVALRGVDDETVESAIDDEYLRKYAHDIENAKPMALPEARATTLEVVLP